MTTTDVLIVGAGPAGCAAALAARQAGLRVVMLEARNSLPPTPGETLPPGAEAIFRQLGVLERVEAQGFPRHRGIVVAWDGPPSLQLYGHDERGPWLGWQAERTKLNDLLQSAAVASGARLMSNVTARGVRQIGGRVTGVITDQGPLRARYVLDAGGGRHWLARQLGVPIHAHTPRLLAGYGWRPIPRAEPAEPTLCACANGWQWEAQIDDARVAWCNLSFAPAAPKPAAQRDVTWRIAGQTARPGYFLVGDAAMVLDPASSHGLLRAMMSAMQAVHAITSLPAGVVEEEMAAAYHRFMRDWFLHDATHLRALYRKHPTPPEWSLPDATQEQLSYA